MIADRFRRARAAGPPVPFVSEQASAFGPGASFQPSAEVLLRETRGTAEACIRKLADRVASLEIQVVRDRRVESGTVETEVIDDHVLLDVLDGHPNFSWYLLVWLSTFSIAITGEAYWFKVRSRMTGAPMELQPFPGGQVEPRVRAGVVESYRVTDGDGAVTDKPADEVVRIYFPDPENPWRAKGLVGPSANDLDALKFMTQHIRGHYQYDATPKVMIQGASDAVQPSPEQIKRMRESFLDDYNRMSSRRGLPRFLVPGWEAKELTGAAGEATKAYLEFFRESLMMQVGGVPPSLLGRVVSGDRSSAETTLWGFDLHSITPFTRLFEDALNRQLVPEFESEGVRIRFAPFVAPDKDYELRREAQDLEHAIRTPNQVLRDRELDPVEWGDQPIISGKLKPYDPTERAAEPVAPGAEDPATAEDEDDAEDMDERHLHIAARRLARRARRGAA